MPQTIAAGSAYACSFTVAVNGNAGDVETDTATATMSDDDGNTITPSDSATVTITDVAASITVTKTAAPTSVAEPGGNVTFTVRVDNSSAADAVTISSLVDDIHGDLNGQGTCSVPQTIAAGGFYQCAFTAALGGNAGDTETDTVTASGTDDDSNPVSAQDSATVTITDVLPTATVTKSALPATVAEPGGDVTFSVVVANTGTAESLDLSVLVDDIHGDLNGQGDCVVPQTIAADGSYACSFTVAVNGNAGDAETDTVTATLSDDDSNTITPSDTATVTITGTDWGDAPDPTFPTLLANDGARHTIVAGFFLGAGVDAEPNGQPDATATGDDNDGPGPGGGDDEDGVSFVGPLVPGTTVAVAVIASAPGVLDAWIDFDGNGSWAEAGEQVFAGVALSSGTNNLSVDVPTTVAAAVVARFRLSSTGGLSFDGAAPDGEVEDYRLIADGVAPQVSFIDSRPDTGDGQLTPCESTQISISEIRVVFDEPMRTGRGPGAADDLASYRLIAPGVDASFGTVSCSAVGGDDVLLPMRSVTYFSDTPAPPQATATLRLTAPLVNEHVRLLVCGTLEDTAGNALDGGDFSLDFRVDALNLFQNGHFDCDLEDWILEPASSGQIQHAPIDADGSMDSGSLEARLLTTDSVAVAQCGPVVPRATFEVGGRFRVDAPEAAQVRVVRQCDFFDQARCGGAAVSTLSHVEFLEDTSQTFVAREATTVVAPTAASALCFFEITPVDFSPLDGVPSVVYVDRLFARSSTVLFADGFESGDTSAWTATTP